MSAFVSRYIEPLTLFTQHPSAGLFLLAFVISFFFSGTDTVWFAPALFLFLSWAALALGHRVANMKTLSMPSSATAGLIGAFTLYLWFALCFSSAPFISSLFTLIFSLLALVPFTLWNQHAPQKTATDLLKMTITPLILVALWALVQFFFFYDEYGPRIHHPFLNPNSLAALLNMGFILAVAFFMTADNRRKALGTFAVVVVLAAALYVTRSRGAFLAASTALIVLLPFVSRPFDKVRRRRLVALFLGLAVIVFGISFWAEIFYNADFSRTMKINFESASFVDRQALWSAGFAMMRDNGLMGPGLATFSYFYPAYRLPVDMSDGYFVHMDPLQVGVETGILGWMLFYAVMLAVLCRTIKALNRTQPGDPARRNVIMAFAALLTVTLHSHISFHFYILVTASFAALLLGFWYVHTAQVLEERGKTLSFSGGRYKTGLVILLVVFLIPGQWLLRAGYATYMLQQSQKAMAAGNVGRAESYLDSIEQWGPSRYAADGQQRARIIIQKLNRPDAELSLSDKQALFNVGLAAIDDAIAYNSGLAGFLNTKAQLYYTASGFIPGAKDTAVAILEQALEKDPLLLDARIGLARIYEERGEFRKSLSVLDGGMKWPRRRGFIEVRYLMRMASLNLRLGNRAEYDRLKAFAIRRAEALGYSVQDAP